MVDKIILHIKTFYKKLRFDQKLSFSFCLVILLPLLMLATFSSYSLKNAAMEKGKIMSQQALQLSVTNVDGLMDSAVSIAKVIVADNRVQDYYMENRNITPAEKFEEKNSCKVFWMELSNRKVTFLRLLFMEKTMTMLPVLKCRKINYLTLLPIGILYLIGTSTGGCLFIYILPGINMNEAGPIPIIFQSLNR